MGRRRRRDDDLADFLIVEEWREVDSHETAAGVRLVLPVRDRRPTDPGFVLSWREHRHGDDSGRWWGRSGVVLARAPRDGAVWVVPDERRDGEGLAVLVCNATRDDASAAVRRVGAPEDEMSTATWQAAWTRAWDGS